MPILAGSLLFGFGSVMMEPPKEETKKIKKRFLIKNPKEERKISRRVRKDVKIIRS